MCNRIFKLTGKQFFTTEKNCLQCDNTYINYIIKLLEEAPKKLITQKEKLNIQDMASNFFLAMARWAKSGFKTVSKETYIERMMCCTTCGDGTTCPHCGCLLKAKDRLASEKECPSPETYPNLKTYPKRNYWDVCNETTSIILSAAPNEIYLNKTIESLITNATGKIEILVGLDGWDYDVIKHEKVKIVKSERVGRRIMCDKLVKMSMGKYLFEIDAHCKLTEGYDTKLKCSCLPNTIVSCVLSNIDLEKWETMDQRWLGGIIDANMRWKWWDRVPKNMRKVEEEIPCFISACWMIDRPTYDKYGGHDTDLGVWANECLEWFLKIQCGGGKMIARTDVDCAHWCKKQFNYPIKVNLAKDIKTLTDRWHGSNPNQIYTIDQVIQRLRDKFGALPSWDLPHNGGTLTDADWLYIQDIIKKYKIKKIVEFGSGRSTELFDKYAKTISYETSQGWIDKIKTHTKNTTFKLWSGKTIERLPKDIDFALIDGPAGGNNREFSYISVAASLIRIVACHDSSRAEDKQWIKKYFDGWKVLSENKTKPGLLILERPI